MLIFGLLQIPTRHSTVFYQKCLVCNLCQRQIGEGIGVKFANVRHVVFFCKSPDFFRSTAILTGESAGACVYLRCNQAGDAQLLTDRFQQKFRRCRNNNIIRLLLVRIPLENFMGVQFPIIINQFADIDSGKKTEKVFFQFRFADSF